MMLLEHQHVDVRELGGLALRHPLVLERLPGVDVQRDDAELASPGALGRRFMVRLCLMRRAVEWEGHLT
jgi:hypothetical protein